MANAIVKAVDNQKWTQVAGGMLLTGLIAAAYYLTDPSMMKELFAELHIHVSPLVVPLAVVALSSILHRYSPAPASGP
jgi:hypothetical protein